MNRPGHTGTIPFRIRLRWLWPLPVLIVVCSLPAFAQLSAADEFSSRNAVSGRLEAVKAELDAAQGLSEAAHRDSLEQIEVTLYLQLEAIDELEQMDRENHDLKIALRDWHGFDRSPPYSILFVDELRSKRDSLGRQQQAAESRHRIINQAVEDLDNQLLTQQATERRHEEQAGLEQEGDERQKLLHAAQGEALTSRILVESVAHLKLRQASHELQLQAIASAVELNALQISAVRGHVQFTEDELGNILRRIDAERADLLALVKARRAEAIEGPQVTWKIEFLEFEKVFWTQLHKALNSDLQTGRLSAVEQIHATRSTVDDWVDVVRLRTLEDAEESVGEATSPNDLLRVVRLQKQIGFALEELELEGVRGESLLDKIIGGSLVFWNFELYLAEETVSVGGNKVTLYSQVTIGKLLRLAFILVLGWLAVRYISRGFRLLAIRWAGASETTANTVGSWSFGVGLVLLIVIGLNRVHIPFTAFAFLGGTLAIGIGFGTQNLLKNFISGIILRLERPFRIGDLITVEGIVGHIRHIGMRASLIRHFSGIETLVPNSSMLETKVNNWTLHDNALRGEVTMGVAYGTQSKEVANTLMTLVKQHSQVLGQPEPEVRFDAFGDNALEFKLLYWFDASKEQGENLESSLRFRIDQAFEDAGIVFAFPQRDIHFDDNKPLRIEVSRSSKPA